MTADLIIAATFMTGLVIWGLVGHLPLPLGVAGSEHAHRVLSRLWGAVRVAALLGTHSPAGPARGKSSIVEP